MVRFVNVKNITARSFGFDIVVATSVRDAVADADLISTCTGDKTQAAGRTRDDQITIFDSVGFAIEDFSALRYLRDSVAGTSFFDELDLIADPVDPRNLFGLVPDVIVSISAWP